MSAAEWGAKGANAAAATKASSYREYDNPMRAAQASRAYPSPVPVHVILHSSLLSTALSESCTSVTSGVNWGGILLTIRSVFLLLLTRTRRRRRRARFRTTRNPTRTGARTARTITPAPCPRPRRRRACRRQWWPRSESSERRGRGNYVMEDAVGYINERFLHAWGCSGHKRARSGHYAKGAAARPPSALPCCDPTRTIERLGPRGVYEFVGALAKVYTHAHAREHRLELNSCPKRRLNCREGHRLPDPPIPMASPSMFGGLATRSRRGREFWTSTHCRHWLLPSETLSYTRGRQQREGGFDADELTLLLARPPNANAPAQSSYPSPFPRHP